MNLSDLKYKNTNINLDEYIEFTKIVKETMDYPEWLGNFEKEDLEILLNNGSKIWIYYLDEIPVCSMMLILNDSEKINKLGLKINSKELVDYGPMFVNPKYIGNGLQYQMLKELDNYCIQNELFFAFCTVHPDNKFSINNLEKDNFLNFGQKTFKRGLRNLYFKCLKEEFNQKILTFIVRNNKFLLLKGSENDPQFSKSFWYVVTGSVEKSDITLEDAVKREVKEETNLTISKIKRLPLTFQYKSLNRECLEYAFISFVNDEEIILNEESIDYKWCDIDEFMELINWYYSKEELKNLLIENKEERI